MSIEELAKELNQQLLNNETIQEFKKYEQLIDNHPTLSLQEEKIKELQKEIVRQKANQDDTVVDTIRQYQQLKEEFDQHPYIVNYLYLKEEVNQILQSINVLINGQL